MNRYVVFGDQLGRAITSLRDIDAAEDMVLMMEVAAEARYIFLRSESIEARHTSVRPSPNR